MSSSLTEPPAAPEAASPPEKTGKTSRRWWAHPRQLLRQVLHLDDTPHAIALGAAVGMFVGWTPTVGVQMVIVLLLAGILRPFLRFNEGLRFNQFAALVGVYVSNPITTVPMYWGMYRVGAVFFPGTVSYERFGEVLKYESFAGWWNTVWTLFVDIGLPLIVGSLILATVCSLLTYPAMRWLLRKEAAKPATDEAEVSKVVLEPPNKRLRDLALRERFVENGGNAKPSMLGKRRLSGSRG